MKMSLKFKLNGEEIAVETHPMSSLLETLRYDAAETGTKYGCGEGECGACTVIMNGETVMSCMVPACQAEGAEIETVEGLSTVGLDGEIVLHPIQQAFIETSGAQCGICTPGMMMSGIYYQRHPERAPGGIREALEGNLCRCTGYTAIFEAMKRVAEVES